MSDYTLTRVQPQELLDAVRLDSVAARYNLSICYPETSLALFKFSGYQPCGVLDKKLVCGKPCSKSFMDAVQSAVQGKRAKAFRCPIGLIGFVVPVESPGQQTYCFIAGNMREASLNLFFLDELIETSEFDATALNESLEAFLVMTLEEAEAEGERIRLLTHTLQQQNVHSNIFARTMQNLQTVTAVLAELDRQESLDEVVSLIGEILTIIFDLERIVIALRSRDGESLEVVRSWNTKLTQELIPFSRFSRFAELPYRQSNLLSEEVNWLLPEVTANNAYCLPAVKGKELVGLLILLDADPNPRDLVFFELLADRLASAVSRIVVMERSARETTGVRQILGMLDVLAQVDGADELHAKLLNMAAEIVSAGAGSLMLLDAEQSNLYIRSAKGMNRELARNLVIPVGQAIAGKVACTGSALLVADVEHDTRFKRPNRPRYRGKSFLSMPLLAQERVIGVLNLSDKDGNGMFTDKDLKALELFTRHAVAMIGRGETLERSRQLESLAVNDPLTGLYNMRSLIRRLEEEVSRSSRLGIHFSVLMVDLDNFTAYNTLCGSQSAEAVLRKIAEVLISTARAMDVIARYGSEKFCIVLPACPPREAFVAAERMRKEIENHRLLRDGDDVEDYFTVCIGMAAFPESGLDSQALISAADSALYQAKAEGQNRIAVHSTAVSSSPSLFRHSRPAGDVLHLHAIKASDPHF